MKRILPLLKMSAKKSFQLLRERSPFFCDALGVEVQVTKMFFRHITYARERQDVELIRRLLMVPFIDEILEKGQLIVTKHMEGRFYHRISSMKEGRNFIVIVWQKGDVFVLRSCFIKY